ncbi:MAG: alpha/beta hydrolase [Acidimicrobiales bacterium]
MPRAHLTTTPPFDHRHRWMRALAALVAVVVLASACSDDATTDASDDGGTWTWPTDTAPPSTDPGDDTGEEAPDSGERTGSIDWSTSGSLDQGTLEVPLDHSDPDAGTIELAVARRPAADPDDRIGAILVNFGGPGASGVEMAGFLSFLFSSDLRDRFDLVTWDPRGVGDSTQVRCGDGELMDRFVAADPVPQTPEAEAEVEAIAAEFAEACERDSGELLPHLHTKASARDMDLIRAAMGEEEISYVGFSYGTVLGATYAELFPDRVRAAVLDGAYSRSLGLADKSEGQAMGFERSLNAWFDWCTPQECSFAAGGDPPTQFDQLFETIRAGSLPTDDPDGRRLTVGLAWTGVLAALYTPELWPQLDRGLTMARDDGDGSGLLSLADFYNERSSGGEYSTLHYAFTAYNCMDSPAPTPAEEQAAVDAALDVAPRVGPVFVSAPSPCEFWPVEAHGSDDPFSIPDAPPILVVATTGDPATPYEWGVQLADELDTGHLLSVEGEGHTAFGTGNACVDRTVETYLVDLDLPDAGFECAA